MTMLDVDRKYFVIFNVFLAFIHFTLIVSGGYAPVKIVIPHDNTLKIFTDEEIAGYDGSDDDLPLYMAIKGVVFDVSKGIQFYGKGKRYNILIGKDATRGVAKMSLDPADLVSDTTGLSDETMEFLEMTYTDTYLAKYPVVGYMHYLVELEAAAAMGKEDL